MITIANLLMSNVFLSDLYFTCRCKERFLGDRSNYEISRWPHELSFSPQRTGYTVTWSKRSSRLIGIRSTQTKMCRYLTSSMGMGSLSQTLPTYRLIVYKAIRYRHRILLQGYLLESPTRLWLRWLETHIFLRSICLRLARVTRDLGLRPSMFEFLVDKNIVFDWRHYGTPQDRFFKGAFSTCFFAYNLSKWSCQPHWSICWPS